ncbi:Fe(2+) transporter permease subunit FeoB [Treponema zuelzerae]|uniref:Ferrous iron transport protein B n=1 Tax=Teretinema zuelzerae TaxID=156 RepID=A0AAE3EJT3_9SPIR|nr:Fe(2+) transporter permease subunit FeoB [Teretinema zuelzerae]MCD1655131.1 Fe(2+) transporter permease subunit FeoB [Teretinema zuelzerae]
MKDGNKALTIAIAGNPNSGKTTLFNALTGSRQRVGNWPGVTVEKKTGDMPHAGKNYTIVDLPGIYSLSSHSDDERAARDYLLSNEAGLVVNIVDASNLERNLFLTLSLIEMRVPLIVVLNMMDLAEKKGIKIDPSALSASLGVPVMAISAVNADDVKRVRETIAADSSSISPSRLIVPYPTSITAAASAWKEALAPVASSLGADPDWLSIKLLEGDSFLAGRVADAGVLSSEDIERAMKEIESAEGDTPDSVIASAKYETIASASGASRTSRPVSARAADRLDRLVLNRFLGIPLFLGVMYLLFAVVINFGGAFIDFFDILFGAVFVDGFALLLESGGAPSWLVALLANGVGAGIQTVSTFVPIMFMMFFMLSLLEDSGYMARAAFVMDRALRAIGLPGKAFIPMIVGFGCTVPAVMATRTLENKRDRYLSVFMVPFMSCGARLPVYALFGAAFFGASSGLVVLSLYLTGIVLAVLTGFLLKNTLFKGEPAPFVMELPPWHLPRLGAILRHSWSRLSSFVVRAGRVIIIVVALLGMLNTIGTDGSIGNEDTESSVLASVGRAITPVFAPMGISADNWPATVGIFTGLFAKEAVVGTLNGLYGQMAVPALDAETDENPSSGADGLETAESSAPEESWSLMSELQAAFRSIPEGLSGLAGTLRDPAGMSLVSEDESTIAEEIEADEGLFTSLRNSFGGNSAAAYAYLLFILIYFPCFAALGAIVREIGPVFGAVSVTYLTVLAWIVATLFYQIASGGQAFWIVFACALLVLVVGIFAWMGRANRKPAIARATP